MTEEGGTADQSTKVNILINSEEEGRTAGQSTRANTLMTLLTGEVVTLFFMCTGCFP